MLKRGQSIWYCWVNFGETVHATALGFTTTDSFFCHAETKENAELGTRLCIERGGKSYGTPIKVRKVEATPALSQDVARYVWPEKHVDAEAEIDNAEKARQAEATEEATLKHALNDN